MARYIDADVLLKEVDSLEQLARKRVYDTPTNSPAYERYYAQYQERERMLAILKAQPTADVVPKRECEACAEKTMKTIVQLQDRIKFLKKYDEERDIALHARLISNAKTEAVMKIFAEIEVIVDHTAFADCWSESGFRNRIIELKKKCIGEQE